MRKYGLLSGIQNRCKATLIFRQAQVAAGLRGRDNARAAEEETEGEPRFFRSPCNGETHQSSLTMLRPGAYFTG